MPNQNVILVLLLAAVSLCACEKSPAPATQPVAAGDSKVTVASLVPAASDLIDAMGARDQLVAVSNFDSEQVARELPRVGDYQNADWERLRQLRPGVMVIFQDPARVSEGWKQRAAELNVKLVNVRTETLADIYAEATRLGDLIGQSEKAADLVARMKRRLEAVGEQVRGRPRVRTLVVRNTDATGVVGRENFIDDVLRVAGGENAVAAAGWPTIDREKLRQLAPEAIIVLLSGVPEHVEAEARRNVTAVSDLAAVREGRVHVINEWYTQQSGSHVVDLAERMARALHGEPATTRSGR